MDISSFRYFMFMRQTKKPQLCEEKKSLKNNCCRMQVTGAQRGEAPQLPCYALQETSPGEDGASRGKPRGLATGLRAGQGPTTNMEAATDLGIPPKRCLFVFLFS